MVSKCFKNRKRINLNEINVGLVNLYSVFISYNFLFVDVPGAPRNLQPTEVNKSSVTLTWEVPEQDGGSPVTGYIVERRQTTATRWTKAHKQILTEIVFTATDLVEMSEYEFRVAAENAAGIGKPCEPIGPILTKSPYGMYISLHCEISNP